MKNIQPIQLWVNGSQVTATQFQLQSIFDNLLNTAIFNWQLFDVNSTPLTKGELTIVEPQYDQWGVQTDANEWAYEWAATQLNITLA